MKQALHFGAGNIGRGFIGKVLADAGYRVTFVDVNATLIDELNLQGAYTVHYAEAKQRSFRIEGVSGLHSLEQEQDVIDAIASADLVTTAVGAHILPHIAPVIAKGLQLRLPQHAPPLHVIACENAVGGSDQLKDAVLAKLSEEEQAELARQIAFPNAAVDRIVPNQHQDNPLDVLVEPFFEWVVDASAWKGDLPAIPDIHFVDKLEAYIERKLFTVNTGHALTAYTGYQAGLATVQDAMKDQAVVQQVRQALSETGDLICSKHGFDRDEHAAYIEQILSRFENPFIIDDITRVARQPIKKLGYHERLISPVRQLHAKGAFPQGLIKGIACAMQFDAEGDEEAVLLQQRLQQEAPAKVLSGITGLPEDHEIVKAVVDIYNA